MTVDFAGDPGETSVLYQLNHGPFARTFAVATGRPTTSFSFDFSASTHSIRAVCLFASGGRFEPNATLDPPASPGLLSVPAAPPGFMASAASFSTVAVYFVLASSTGILT